VTVRVAAEAVLAEARRQVEAGELAHASERLIRLALERHVVPIRGEMLLARLDRARLVDLEDRLTAKGYSAELRRTVRWALRRCYRWAMERGHVDVDPTRDLPPIRRARTQPPTTFTPEQARALLAAAPERSRPVFALAFATGLRISEVTGLRWRDVEPGRVTIRGIRTAEEGYKRVAKTHGSLRALAVPAEVTEALLALRQGAEDDAFVWPMSHTTLRADLRAAAKTADVPLPHGKSLHVLRHSSATWLAGAGLPIRDVAARLGHTDASLTLRTYAHALPAADERASEMVGGLLSETGGEGSGE
jgi:integrase